MTDVLTVIGVGGMGQAIARRLGSGKTVLLADYNEETLASVTGSLSADGHHIESRSVDVSSPESVRELAEFAASLGDVTHVAHTAGLSPSQAPAEAILAVDLLGTALVLQEFGEVVAPGGAGVVIASMAGHMFPPLEAEQEKALAHNPPDQLLNLDFISSITDPNYRLSDRQAGQPHSCPRRQRPLGPARCAHQFDQSRHHLHADGSAGTCVPRRRRHASDDRHVRNRPPRHSRRHRLGHSLFAWP